MILPVIILAVDDQPGFFQPGSHRIDEDKPVDANDHWYAKQFGAKGTSISIISKKDSRVYTEKLHQVTQNNRL